MKKKKEVQQTSVIADIDSSLLAHHLSLVEVEKRNLPKEEEDGKDGAYEEEPIEAQVLPLRLKEFALRYAFETKKKTNEWAALFGVSTFTILKWLRNSAVQSYIHSIRNDRTARIIERVSMLEVKAYDKLSAILDLPTNSNHSETIRKSILDALAISKGKIREEGGSVQVLQQNNNSAAVLSVTQMSVEKMKSRLKELDDIESVLDEEE